MSFAEERRHMVLTLAVIDNILYDNKLFMLLVKCYAEHLARVYLVAGINLLIHPGYTGWCFKQSLTLWILTDQL
ncbi:hypothetical protein D3C78_1383300 [compost metagenome]